MSSTGTFKSSTTAATEHSFALQGAMGQMMGLNLMKGLTNLTVMDNIREASQKLSGCNNDFKQLVRDDANTIESLAEAFDNLDAEMAAGMFGK